MDESNIDEDLSFYSCADDDAGERREIDFGLVAINTDHVLLSGVTSSNDRACDSVHNDHRQDEVDMLGIEYLISQIDSVLSNQPITFEQGRKRARAAVVADKNDDADAAILDPETTSICANVVHEKSSSTFDNIISVATPVIDVEEDSFVFDLDEMDELNSLAGASVASSDQSEDLDFNAIVNDADHMDRIEVCSNEFIEIDESLYNENILPPSESLASDTCGNAGDDAADHPPDANSGDIARESSGELDVAVVEDKDCASAASHDCLRDTSGESDEDSTISEMSRSTITIPSIDIPPPSILAPPTVNEFSRRVIELSADRRKKYHTVNSRVRAMRHQAPVKSALMHSVAVKKSDVYNASLHWFNSDKSREYSCDHDENMKPVKRFEKPTISSKSRLGSPRVVTPAPSCTAASAVIVASNVVKTVI
jgi:hypothetical protein